MPDPLCHSPAPRQPDQGALLSAIYDAGLDPGGWVPALTALRKALGGEASLLFHRDSTVAMRHCEYIAISGWDSAAMAAYQAHYGGIDIRTPFVALTPIGRVHTDDKYIAYSDVTRSEIFADFYRPRGLGRSMAAKLFASDNRHGLVSVHRAIDNGPFPSETVALFESLAPHIVRALQLQRQVQRAEAFARGLVLTLDHFPLAVLLVTEAGRVRHMNARAAEFLREVNCPLRVTADRLMARDVRAADALLAQIDRAIALAWGEPGPPPALIKLRRADPTLPGLSLMVAPLRQAKPIGLVAEPLAAVFVSDPSIAPPLDKQLLMQQFGLTQAEAALASALVEGTRLADFADTKHVSIETSRKQLKNVMAKTDSRSQGQLIGLLTRGLALLRRDGGGKNK